MTNWLNYPITLTGETVDLISLNEEHFAALADLAKEKSIWEFYPTNGSDPNTFQNILNASIIERENGNQFPFVIFHKQENKIVGSTRFLDIQEKHKNWKSALPGCIPIIGGQR